MFPVFKDVVERYMGNRLLVHQEKCGLFYFQCGFRSSQSTADLLTVVSDRIARALNRCGTTQAVFFTNLKEPQTISMY